MKKTKEFAPLETPGKLPLALDEEQIEFWKKLTPVNRPAATDTYKRTMATSGEVFNKDASYTLAARKGLKEEGADGRFIMAGLERLLYPYFGTRVTEKEVRKAEGKFKYATEINKFPTDAWKLVLQNDGFFPIDIYGFPGGQTFLVKSKDGAAPLYVPCLSVEGSGALVSHLEPHILQGYKPIIYATKARLMKEAAGEKFAEFGYRGAANDLDHTVLMLALKVGANYFYTSGDETVYLFDKEFTSIGTVGHEYLEAYQRTGVTLEESQELACRDFVKHNQKAALLPDIISTTKSGFPLILKLMKENENTGKVIMPRVDSGNILEQVLTWKKMTLEAGYQKTSIVIEDGVTPTKAKAIREAYQKAGHNPDELIFGAGGYFQEGNTRDAISFAYKRASTEYDSIDEANIKLSDTIGKGSLPGPIRVYERGSTLIVARKGEIIDGKPLFVPLLKNGRINYFETQKEQNERAERTWKLYDNIEYSPEIKSILEAVEKERSEIVSRYR